MRGLSMWRYCLCSAGLFVLIGCLDADVLSESDEFDHHLHYAPSWSPDGSRLAFFNLRGTDRLSIVDATTGNITLVREMNDISKDLIYWSSPVWAPSSNALYVSDDTTVYRVGLDAATLDRTTIPTRIMSITPDGMFAVSSISSHRDPTTGSYTGHWSRFNLTTGALTRYELAAPPAQWHRTLERFIFGESRSDSVGAFVVIWTLNPVSQAVDTLGIVRTDLDLVRGSVSDYSSGLRLLSLDPLSERALVSYWIFEREVLRSRVLVGEINGAPAHDLGRIFRPKWSGDGTRIAFEYPLRRQGGLGIINSDGTGERVLTGP